MFDLTGKKALVTGATQGIGFEIARLLSQQGAKVYMSGHKSMEKCSRAAMEIPKAVPVVADLACEDAADRLYEATGDVDILVLNASVQYIFKLFCYIYYYFINSFLVSLLPVGRLFLF